MEDVDPNIAKLYEVIPVCTFAFDESIKSRAQTFRPQKPFNIIFNQYSQVELNVCMLPFKAKIRFAIDFSADFTVLVEIRDIKRESFFHRRTY